MRSVDTLPSGAHFDFRKWKLKDMERWAEMAQETEIDTDAMAECCGRTITLVADPGPYGFLKAGATTVDMKRLLKDDLSWLLYRIRAKSFPDDPEHKLTGEDYVFDWRCQHSTKEKKHFVTPRKIRLCDLKMRPLPAESAEHVRTGKPFTKTLPSGVVVQWVLPTIGVDRELHDWLKKKTAEDRRKNKRAPERKAKQSDAIACCVTHISALGENQSFDRRAEFIGEMEFDDFAAMSKAMTASGPSIKKKIDCVCDECGEVTEVTLPLTPGFFLPSMEMEEEAEETEEVADETPEPGTVKLLEEEPEPEPAGS